MAMDMEAQYARALRIGRTPQGFALLKQAALGQNDDFDQIVANMALKQLTKTKTALQGAQAQQQLAQNGKQTVSGRILAEADQALPEMSGIGRLPAPGMETLAAAQGGIVGYADGGSVGYAPGGSVILNGVEYPIDPVTGKVMYKGVPTDPKLLQQSAATPWADRIQAQPEYKQSTKDWLGAQDTARDQQYFADQKQMREDIAGGKGINWKGGYYPIIQEGANKGKVDYKGVPTAMNMFPGAEGAVPAMPTSTPWKSDTSNAALETVVPSAPAAASPTKKPDVAPAAAPGVEALLSKNDKAAPAALRLSQPGTAVEDPTKAQERTRDQRLSDVKEILKTMRGERGDEFADVKAQLQEDKKALETMKSEGLGYMLLSAAGKLLEPGQTTSTALGRGLASFGETGLKYQPQLLAARQGISSGQQRLAEAQAAADRGDMQTAATLAGQFSTEDIARAKMAQDYKLGMAQLDIQRAAANKNPSLDLVRAIAGDPKLAAAYQQMHGYGERTLTDKDIIAGFKEFKDKINPATKKFYTLPEYIAEVRASMGGIPAAGGAGLPTLAQITSELQRRGIK